MTSSHVIYIPLILMAGMVIGFAMGRHSAAREREEAERRLQARKARASKLQAKLGEKSSSAEPGSTEGEES